MPYGYAKYLENEKNRSILTIDEHVRQINYFFGFLNLKYKEKPREVYEITSKDIRDYLDSKKAKNYVPKTINKILAILKSFFDYLWQFNKIGTDPVAKIKYMQLEPKYSSLDYQSLLDILPDILKTETYNIQRQTIFILALKGFRAADYHLLKEDIKYFDNNVALTIRANHVNPDQSNRIVVLEGEEAEVFTDYYNKSMFTSSDYLFTSEKWGSDAPTPIEPMTIYQSVQTITEDYGLGKLNLSNIRYAYVKYLYSKQNMSIQEIANHFGLSEKSAHLLIARVKERMPNKVLNKLEAK